MKKTKLLVGIFAFVGLAALNFTQSENCLVNKAFASSSDSSSSSTSTSSSSTSSSSSNYAYAQKLSSLDCTITKINGSVTIVVSGIVVKPGASYEVKGTKLDCTFYALARCNQSDITHCQEIK